ncbi:MAG: DMT family transporter [Burkholderiales bacterium]|nr:DMT family transporter [Burkholderiales bacterium]
MSSAALAAANRHGILCMSGAMALFIVNDAFIKYVSASLPAAQMIFVRSVLVTLIVFGAARALGATARLPLAGGRLVALRAFIDACATMFYLASLAHLPIANATAINLAAPLFMTVFAVLFLRETVSAGRWLAIGAGFVGVLLVIQPRAQGFNAWALLTLVATVFHAARDLLTRGIAPEVPSILVTLASAVAATLLSGAWLLTQGWQPMSPAQGFFLLCAAVFVAGGFYLIIASMRRGEMSVVGPFRYSGLLVALVLGYAIWGDVPNPLAWGGIALIIGSGLYILVSARARAA